MFPLIVLCLAFALSLAYASPIQKRALSQNDASALQLALFLENLEFSLYSGGCQNFTDAQYTDAGFPSGFRENICTIAMQELVHINSITSVLETNGVSGLPPCAYNFPYNNATSFVALANQITSVGLGSYLGGLELLTDSPVLEVVAGSILAVEARHDTFLRVGIGASPFPTSFDTALSAVWAYNLAQKFVASCPQQLPFTILPKLNLTSPSPLLNLQPPMAATTVLNFAWDPSTFFVAVDQSSPLYIAIVNQNVSSPVYQRVTMTGSGTGTIRLPGGLSGVAFACLTTFAGGLTLDQLSTYGTLAGPVEIVIS